MSDVISKPSVPRPSVRKTDIPKAYESAPPVIRDRMPTLDLADEDVLEAEPVVARPRSVPPPPPLRSTIVPKLETVAAVPKIAPLTAPVIERAVASMPLPLPHTLKLIAATPTLVPVRGSTPPPSSVSRSNAPTMPAPAPASVPASVPAPISGIDVKRVVAPEPVKARLESLLDPTEILFEGMYELELVESAWQAATVCATALARALGARAVVVHAHDLGRRELRTIGVHGERTADLLGSSDLSDDDLVASAVICNEKPVTMRFDGELPRLAPRRLEILGAPRTLVAVPAMAWGRCVAMIEIIDADERYAGRVADSAAYVAGRLAAYLSGRLAA